MHGLKGELRRNEPMNRHTSWRTGGPAKWFYTPYDANDLGEFIRRVPNSVSIAWCGLGSNILVRDGGYPGVVISTLKGLNRIYKVGESGVYAEAGVPGAKVAKFAVKNALGGAEFLVGIPGTVGGALAMNAGCFGLETWEIVRFAETMNRTGAKDRKDASRIRRGYRYVEIAVDEWFIAAEFKLVPRSMENGRKNIRELLKRRTETQPIQTANAGSVFRNPPKDYAARLLETAGLKGFEIGKARISLKHANFIENQGNATALEIEELISHAMKRVQAVHGVSLEPEVKIIGIKT